MALLIGCALFAVLGLVLACDVGRAATRVAALGRWLRDRPWAWASAGAPTSPTTARVLGALVVLLALLVAALPPQ